MWDHSHAQVTPEDIIFSVAPDFDSSFYYSLIGRIVADMPHRIIEALVPKDVTKKSAAACGKAEQFAHFKVIPAAPSGFEGSNVPLLANYHMYTERTI
jgi:hypothetical protein